MQERRRWRDSSAEPQRKGQMSRLKIASLSVSVLLTLAGVVAASGNAGWSVTTNINTQITVNHGK